MPNWCKGTLKVRGKISDLKRFVLEGLEPVNVLGEKLDSFKFEDEDEKSFFLATGQARSWIWIRDTRRHFCESDYIEAYADDNDTPTVLLLPMKAAWGMEAGPLRDVCKKFNIDMRIQGFERGMEFSQFIEIINGEITHDDEIKYDDWRWDCPCPLLGG